MKVRMEKKIVLKLLYILRDCNWNFYSFFSILFVSSLYIYYIQYGTSKLIMVRLLFLFFKIFFVCARFMWHLSSLCLSTWFNDFNFVASFIFGTQHYYWDGRMSNENSYRNLKVFFYALAKLLIKYLFYKVALTK